MVALNLCQLITLRRVILSVTSQISMWSTHPNLILYRHLWLHLHLFLCLHPQLIHHLKQTNYTELNQEGRFTGWKNCLRLILYKVICCTYIFVNVSIVSNVNFVLLSLYIFSSLCYSFNNCWTSASSASSFWAELL